MTKTDAPSLLGKQFSIAGRRWQRWLVLGWDQSWPQPSTPLIHLAVLLAPFLAAVAILRGLTKTIETFHGTDEQLYHVPLIMKFAREFPSVDLVNYPVVPNPPIFHLFFAFAGKILGFELWRLRLINVVISYAVVVLLYRFLIKERRFSPLVALAVALLFALSPYFFGASFLLLTDNVAILFALLAVVGFASYRREPCAASFARGCAWTGLAVLVRPSYVWLVPFGLLWALPADHEIRRLTRGGIRCGGTRMALMAAALVPYGLLVIAWGGLVPPDSDPTACGVCSGGLTDGLSLRPVGFTLAVFGLYAGVLLIAPTVTLRISEALRIPSLVATTARVRLMSGGLALVAGALLLIRTPLQKELGDDGYLWRLSEHGPSLAQSSWLFWVLIPIGCVILATRYTSDHLPIALFGCFLASTLAAGSVYQKYFDPIALLTAVLLIRPSEMATLRQFVSVVVLVAGFVAYALSFAR